MEKNGYQEIRKSTSGIPGIERINAYIDRTKIPNDLGYDIKTSEISILGSLGELSPFRAIIIAFLYGKAKGYRMAKAKTKYKT